MIMQILQPKSHHIEKKVHKFNLVNSLREISLFHMIDPNVQLAKKGQCRKRNVQDLSVA